MSYDPKNPSNKLHTENLVVRCSDFRLREFLGRWTTQELGSADELVAPGAGLIFLREGRATAALDDLRTLRFLHDFSDVWIVFHTECGAYKHFRGGNTPDSERAAQVEDAQKIKTLLEGEGLKVHFRLVTPAGEFVTLADELTD